MCRPPTPNPRKNAPSTPTAMSLAKAVVIAPAATTNPDAGITSRAAKRCDNADQKMLAGTCEMAKVLAVHTATDGGTPLVNEVGHLVQGHSGLHDEPGEGEQHHQPEGAGPYCLALGEVDLVGDVLGPPLGGGSPSC